MLELDILTGTQAGLRVAAKEFPFQIGRRTASGLSLEDQGVWEKHAIIILEKDGRFKLAIEPCAPALHDSAPFTERIIRNGDVIQLGLPKIQFSLGKASQRRLAIRECCTWAIPIIISLAQIALIYALQVP